MTISLILAMLILLSTASACLYGYLHMQITAKFDEALLAKAAAMHSLLKRDEHGRAEFDFSNDLMPEFNKSKFPEYFQLRSGAGTTIERSDSLGNFDLSLGETRSGATQFSDVALPDGRPGRAIRIQVSPISEDGDHRRKTADQAQFSLVIARDRLDLDRTFSAMTWGFGGTVVFLSLAVGGLVPWLVSRNLSPLEQMAGEASQIDAHSLSRRFPVASMPLELQPICARLNDSLVRLQTAFERERRFSADVAHELRTPISELRLLAELALKFPGDAESSSRSFTDSLDIARQMEIIVGTLLQMIDGESRIPQDELEPVDVIAIFEDAWRSLRGRAGAKSCELTQTSPPILRVISNGTVLRLIFLNLLSNAIEHSPAGSSIECRFGGNAGEILFSISNPASNLTSDDLPHLPEPFWRKDLSRTGTHHAGLGLALVACYTRRLGANLEFAITSAGQLIVSLQFARAPDPVKDRTSGAGQSFAHQGAIHRS